MNATNLQHDAEVLCKRPHTPKTEIIRTLSQTYPALEVQTVVEKEYAAADANRELDILSLEEMDNEFTRLVKEARKDIRADKTPSQFIKAHPGADPSLLQDAIDVAIVAERFEHKKEVEHLKAHVAAIVAAGKKEKASTASKSAGVLPKPINAATWALEELPAPEQILEGLIDMACKLILVAPSKAKKSFLLLQLALSLAAGLPTYLAWRIPKPRRVLFWNLEIPPAHLHRRMKRMMAALNIEPLELEDRLLILNTRGIDATSTGLTEVNELVKQKKVDGVIVDPVYKLIPGDESSQEEIKTLLSGLDKLCTETGCTVIYSHHAGKGEAGDRLAIDRASGSGVLARDFDAQIGLVSHIDEGLLVCEPIARNYPPRDPFVISWDNERGCFVMSEAIPIIRTSANRRGKCGRVGPAPTDEDAVALVASKPLVSASFYAELRRLGNTEQKAREIRARLTENGTLAEFIPNTFPRRVYIGTPGSIELFRKEYQSPKLAGLK